MAVPGDVTVRCLSGLPNMNGEEEEEEESHEVRATVNTHTHTHTCHVGYTNYKQWAKAD